MSKKVTYNLNFLAKSVFELDKEDQKILQILAQQKDDEKGINQTQITGDFTNSDRIHNRKTIKRKLIGTNKKIGLIQNEYVIPKKEHKKRYGKDEITFHLTFKGLFGALASGISLKKIHSYKKFLKAVDDHIPDKKINKIIKKYYELQIHSFLLWHHIYGIQLKNKTTFQNYYSKLIDDEFSHADKFGVRIDSNIIKEFNDVEKREKKKNLRNAPVSRERNEKMVTEIINIFSEYFTHKGIIDVLRINGIIATANEFLKPNKNLKDSDEALDSDKLIEQWSNYIGGVHLAESTNEILDYNAYVMPNQNNIKFLPQGFREDVIKKEKDDEDKVKERQRKTIEEINKIQYTQNVAFIPEVTHEIKNILKKNKIEIEIPETLKRNSDVYPF